MTNSLAIMADALHDLGDSIILLSSWKIEGESRRGPDWKRTFGYRRLSLLAAFLNAVVLLGGSVVITFQAAGRLVNPQPVNAKGIIFFAIIGIIANFIGSLRLRHGKTLNERILSWHLLEDVLGWAGILISGVFIHFTGIYIVDPLVTIAVTFFILWGVWRNSKELINIFLEGAPTTYSLASIVHDIEEKVPNIKRIFDVHLWSLDGDHHLFSMKATIANDELTTETKIEIEKVLNKHKITHSTIEISEDKFFSRKKQEQKFL